MVSKKSSSWCLGGGAQEENGTVLCGKCPTESSMLSQTEQAGEGGGPKAGSGEQTRRSKRDTAGSMKLIFIGQELCARRIRKDNGDP